MKRESYLLESLSCNLTRDIVLWYSLKEFSVIHRHEANIWHMEWKKMSKMFSWTTLYKHELKPGTSLLQKCCQLQKRNYLIDEYLSHLIVYNRCGLVGFNLFRSGGVWKKVQILHEWKIWSKNRLVPRLFSLTGMQCVCVWSFWPAAPEKLVLKPNDRAPRSLFPQTIVTFQQNLSQHCLAFTSVRLKSANKLRLF